MSVNKVKVTEQRIMTSIISGFDRIMSQNGWRMLCLATLMATVTLGNAQGSPRSHNSSRPLWRNPGDCERDVWLDAMYNTCNVTHKQELQARFAQVMGSVMIPADGALAYAGMLLTEAQAEDLMRMKLENTIKRRKKRKLLSGVSILEWDTDVYYKVDGSISDKEAKVVDGAIRLWENHTCIRFHQIDVDAEFTESHILFDKIYTSTMCFSYIGRSQNPIPQPIYLAPACFTTGVVAHEIGHALGFIHEHQRADRDDSIIVNWDSIIDGRQSNFIKFPAKDLVTGDLKYDFASIMHYKATANAGDGVSPTIETIDPEMQSTVGQRAELSFDDYRIINMIYCSDTCENTRPERECVNTGYQDPADCIICHCPDGYGGMACDTVAQPVDADCGEQILSADNVEAFILSPGYLTESGPLYRISQQCSWHMQAPSGHNVVTWFEDSFGLFCYLGRCDHWVEIKYKADLTASGPRFCCSRRPDDVIRSETEKMVIVFKAHPLDKKYYTDHNLKGFKLVYVSDGDDCASHPCEHGGDCEDGINSYTCDCKQNYMGNNCQHRIQYVDKCSSAPCLNEGRCTDWGYKYTCDCLQYTWGKNCEHVTREGSLDLVILLDISEKLSDDTWQKMKDFLTSIIELQTVGEDTTHVALVTFDTLPVKKIALADGVSLASIRQTIDSLSFTTWQRESRYFRALWTLRFETLAVSRGNRPAVPDVALLVTDKPPTGNPILIGLIADSIRDNGVSLVAAAVGDGPDLDFLATITGGGDHVVHAADPSDLPQLVLQVNYLLHSLAWPSLFISPTSTLSTTTTSVFPITTTSPIVPSPTTTTSTTRTTATQTTTTKATTTKATTSKATTTKATTTKATTTTMKPTTTKATTTKATTTSTSPLTTSTTTKVATTRVSTQRRDSSSSSSSSSSEEDDDEVSYCERQEVDDEDEEAWCSHECGACGTRVVTDICYNDRDRELYRETSLEQCNIHPCVEVHLFWAEKVYKLEEMKCCGGMRLNGDGLCEKIPDDS